MGCLKLYHCMAAPTTMLMMLKIYWKRVNKHVCLEEEKGGNKDDSQ